MKPKIIIFSGKEVDLLCTQKIFEKEGFEVCGYLQANECNINSLYKNNPDVVLLDLEIISTDGIELCYKLKSENGIEAFVVLYCGQVEDYIQIEAFKAGADDYIARPINPRILIKRIRALLSRKSVNIGCLKPKLLSYKTLQIDRERYLVTVENEQVALPRKEFEILFLLLTDPQRVFSRQEIYTKVWDKDENKNERIIDVHIRKIRVKIGECIIKTVKGVGYQLT